MATSEDSTKSLGTIQVANKVVEEDEMTSDLEHKITSKDMISIERKQYLGKVIQTRKVIMCLGITALALYLRFYRIDANPGVVWDEAHFGKFGSHYIKHEFYHDVHPPLGKLTVALSEWLAGFDGDFEFESGTHYPENVNYRLMRQFQAIIGTLCIPVTFCTTLWLGLSEAACYLASLMVALELSYIALSKFILLDSLLLLFVCTTFACMAKVYSMRNNQLTRKWGLWMCLLGISIGCVCSVKWVGLFITIVVGFYTMIDLMRLYHEKSVTRLQYLKHWLVRIIYLIVIPFMIYLFCFRVHFLLLYKSGTGDSSTNTLFQINLEGNKINPGPRDIVYGSEITIRSNGLSPNLLHSHVQSYPGGSCGHQVTGYGFSDTNNDWVIKHANSDPRSIKTSGKITDGSEIRLFHKETGSNLRMEGYASHVSRGNWEVAGRGTEFESDINDDWLVEIVDQLQSADPEWPREDPEVLHPVSTFFRLRHKNFGCYLSSTGFSYPGWGFKQSEVVCKDAWNRKDKSTWWNVEEHRNKELPDPSSDYTPPKSKFWRDFVLTNFAMASSNNALIPDDDKYDHLASSAWEWPILYRGLRMCGWDPLETRYYLLGSVFNTWLSTIAIAIFPVAALLTALLWKRQLIDISEPQLWEWGLQGGMPFIAWLANYLPFVTMGRVTYIHHYVPALYFAILEAVFMIDFLSNRMSKTIRVFLYIVLIAGAGYSYYYFSPWCQGMYGVKAEYLRMQWFKTWDFIV